MGTMTLTQLENEIRYNLGGRTDLDSRLVTFINWSQDEIARAHRFRDLTEVDTSKSTSDGGDSLALPTGTRNLLAILLIDGTSSRKLIWVPTRKFFQRIPKADEYSETRPTHYTLVGTTVYFWRVPDAVYSLRIYREKWPTALSGASDTSDFTNLDEAICALATAKAFRTLKMKEDEQFWEVTAYGLIRTAILNDKGPFTDQSFGIDYKNPLPGPEYQEDPFVKRMP